MPAGRRLFRAPAIPLRADVDRNPSPAGRVEEVKADTETVGFDTHIPTTKD